MIRIENAMNDNTDNSYQNNTIIVILMQIRTATLLAITKVI